ncbi:MAG TPA: GNAT family N-acetyltransferase [Dermatophilaceae bacterium]|nr:GNAT family N-acetyltransferase [Dermatophilaceae bacterium]
MPVRIVPLTSADAATVIRVDEAAFFQDSSEYDPTEFLRHWDWDRAFAALPEQAARTEEAVGVYTSYDMTVTAPGPGCGLRVLPMEGLSWVGVHPDHRRRGVLRSMMRHHLDWMHDRGIALGGLHAAEVGIYGRFGYGTSSLYVWLKLGRGDTLTAPALDEAAAQVRTRYQPLDSDESRTLIHRLHTGAAAGELGMVTRTEGMARHWLRDIPSMRRGREPDQVMFAEVDGRPTGYAIFSRKHQWEHARPKGEVNVNELVATDPASQLALARRMLDFDLTTSVEFANRRLDDPLVWWTGGPRQVDIRVHDGLWLRLVDLPAALTARGYAAACDVVLEVVDDACPWNAGSWRLAVGADGLASCARVDAPAQLRLPVQALAEAYLGSRSLVSIAQTGSVEVVDGTALYAVSRAFRADTEPISALMF